MYASLGFQLDEHLNTYSSQ